MSWEWQKKDNIDQPLHVLMGAWPVILLGLGLQSLVFALVATVINLGYLFRREYDQHNRWTFNLDLCFGILGCVIGNLVVGIFIYIWTGELSWTLKQN